eukprot:4242924-Pyramimonas_sp.AAC.1
MDLFWRTYGRRRAEHAARIRKGFHYAENVDRRWDAHCNRYHAVRAGFGYGLQCLTPVTYKTNVRVYYLQPPGRDAL